MNERINETVSKIHALLPHDRKVRIMNVCGSHEHTIAFSGMRSLMPENLELIPGPGCPVCVCPESDIINAIELSNRDDVIVVTYGDMLRVPSSRGSIRSEGVNYRMIASPLEAIRIAGESPDKKIVFFSIGFETTTAPAAALLATGVPDNFSMLCSHKLTPAIMEVMVRDRDIGIDGFVAPGHVSAIVGADAWSVFPREYGIPTVVAGFEAGNLLLAILSILNQLNNKEARCDNVYKKVVRPEGNLRAQEIIYNFMEPADTNWRGIGNVPLSGLELREEYSRHNARHLFGLKEIREEKIPGCICGNVILGMAYPKDCKLFSKSCTPSNPRGPCMVSMEGACNIWHNSEGKG